MQASEGLAILFRSPWKLHPGSSIRGWGWTMRCWKDGSARGAGWHGSRPTSGTTSLWLGVW